jgi:amino acid transporter
MMYQKLKRALIGEPLASHRESHQRLSIPVGLSVFASDALSSTAYASEEILIALTASVFAAQAGLFSLPVALGIILLLAIVVLSYRQVVRAYPQGGGTYNVSKARLGRAAGLVAGSALLIDYVLTAAVSTSAGVSAILSTGVFPPILRVPFTLAAIFFIMLVNLRGVKETGRTFVVPVYIFIFSIVATLLAGAWQLFFGNHQIAFHALLSQAPQWQQQAAQASGTGWQLGLLLVYLKAFSHGCAALTGVEAVSDGVKAFREPAALNANRTLVVMAVLLGTMFLGITFLAFGFQVHPDPHETVVSQIARAAFGGSHWMYYVVQISTFAILILGANTAFADFPRLANILAQDGYLPRQLINLGDRLVFSNGVIILSILAMLLTIIYQADTHALIPLYAVGVFIAFTLSQTSMVVYHWQEREPNWWKGLLINGLGAITTGLIMLLLAVEKFTEGAWLVLIAIPAVIQIFRIIKRHYNAIGKQLALPEAGYCPTPVEHTVLVLVSSLNKGTIPALEYAKTISSNVEAVHVELKAEATERLRKAWDEWGCGIPLTILKSPFRSLTEPLLDYIAQVENRYEHDLVTIIVPEFVTKKAWHNLLHNQSSFLIKALLRLRRGKVVTTIRYYLEE